MGCEDRCEVAAAGWPVPYLIDYPGLSVSGAADITGALVGEDHFRLANFAMTWLVWSLVSAATAAGYRSYRRSKTE
jgi:hypothetical protein